MRFLLLLTLGLVGCGAGACGRYGVYTVIQGEYSPYEVQAAYVDPGLAELVDLAVADLLARGVPDVSRPRVVGWRDLVASGEDPRTVGMCYLPERDVYISPTLFGSAAELRSVVTHELAHCMWGVDHDPGEGHIMSEFQPHDVDKWGDAEWARQLDVLARWILDTSPLLVHGP